MPSIITQAIVLRHADYREHDRMLTLLSPSMGRICVVRKENSGTFAVAFFRSGRARLRPRREGQGEMCERGQ